MSAAGGCSPLIAEQRQRLDAIAAALPPFDQDQAAAAAAIAARIDARLFSNGHVT